jgi:hypothetical protein
MAADRHLELKTNAAVGKLLASTGTGTIDGRKQPMQETESPLDAFFEAAALSPDNHRNQ